MKLLLMTVVAVSLAAVFVRAAGTKDDYYTSLYASENGKSSTMEGKVIQAFVHTCNGNGTATGPGYCNGTIRIERSVNGKPEYREFLVPGIAVEKDGKKPVTLTGLINGMARVDYIVKDGFFTATAISVTSTKPKEKTPLKKS